MRLVLKKSWLTVSLVASVVTLTLVYSNCAPHFKAFSDLASINDEIGAGAFKMCSDPSAKLQNQIYVLGSSEYLNIAEDLFPGADLNQLKAKLAILPVVPDAFDGNLEPKAHENFILSRESIIDFFAGEFEKASVAKCGNLASRECRLQILSQSLRKIYRRPVPSTEIVQLVDENMDLSFGLFAKLLFYAPDFHFKASSTDLTPDEFVAKIAMGLFGTFPDDELLAKKDQIFKDQATLKEQLVRLLSDPKNARRLSRRLWKQWLSLQKLEFMELPGEAKIDKTQLIESFYTTIESAILKGESLRDLFFKSSGGEMPTSLLTHPAFALASSRVIGGQLKSHYVHRGVNISAALLCIEMPALPAATIEELENSKKQTAGFSALEAIEHHRSNPRCMSCHSLIDPIGVSMERVSPFGTYRAKFEDGSAIASQGLFLGKQYQDLSSMIQIISESDQVRACFAKNLKGLIDGPEGRRVADCDAKEVFSASYDMPILDSIVMFLSSPRFKDRVPTIEDQKLKKAEEFVALLYLRGLGRPPDAPGLEAWMRNIRAKGALYTAKGILLSDEMRSYNLSDSDFTARAFHSLVGRAGTQAELDSWRSELSGGREALVKKLVESEMVKPRLPALKEGPQ